MIFVERHTEPTPLRELNQKMKFLLEEEDKTSKFSHYSYQRDLRRELLTALEVQFANKCAYCESPLGISDRGEIDQFRPKSLFGTRASLDWNNLFLSCAVCNRNKSDRFPVENDVPPYPLSYLVSVATQQPTLLDPCVDRPDEHLRFTRDGRVHGLTNRGSVTIATFDLNRLQLIEARRQGLIGITQAILNSLHREAPYLASKIHAVRSEADERFYSDTELARVQQKHYDETRERVATDRGDGLQDYREFECYIERIELRNIGTLSELNLDLLVRDQSQKPSFALLGENGIGKSTILRAVACALSGPAYARKLGITSKTLLSDDARRGSIMVRLTGYRNPIEVTIRRNRPLQFSTEGAKTLVLAYGASRLLATQRHKADPGERHAKIRNLFDPFSPVSDASSLLDRIQDEYLEDVRDTLERILNGFPEGQEQIVKIVDGKLRFSLAGDVPRSVKELSDGYKALIGMAGDIVSVMHRAGFKRMSDAMGVVLVDELGNHFHPQLKLRIVSALRSAFPKIQFIYTTHEPLCLRGMNKGEIGVLRRDEQGVYLLTDLPDVATMRVDQLLASEHFGMHSTVDPARAAEIQRYHELTRKLDRSDEEEASLAELRDILGRTDYLGGSRRERMLLNLLDMHDLEDVRAPGENVSVAALSRRTLARLKDIMRAVTPKALPDGELS